MLCVVIMAGGLGSRLGYVCKPLLKICNKPLIQYIIEKVNNLGRVYVALSLRYRELKKWCIENDIEYIVTSGEDYVKDLNYILKIANVPTLILPSDVPFIKRRTLRSFINIAQEIESNIAELVFLLDDYVEIMGEKPDVTINDMYVPSGISLFKKVPKDYEELSWKSIIYPYSLEFLNVNTFWHLKLSQDVCKWCYEEETENDN